MSLVEAIVYVLVALFATGGPVVVFITERAKKQETVTTAQAEIDTVSSIAEEVGIVGKWEDYARIVEEIEEKLTARIDHLEASLGRTRRSLDKVVNYAELLRSHIQKELPPPPPPWPDELV